MKVIASVEATVSYEVDDKFLPVISENCPDAIWENLTNELNDAIMNTKPSSFEVSYVHGVYDEETGGLIYEQ